MRYLDPFSSPSQEYTYLVSPNYWSQALKNHSLLPWLWDLGSCCSHGKGEQRTRRNDWGIVSYLVRQLAQADTYSRADRSCGRSAIYVNYRRFFSQLSGTEEGVWDLALNMLNGDIENSIVDELGASGGWTGDKRNFCILARKDKFSICSLEKDRKMIR